MSIFNTCFNRRGLYLSEDEEEEEGGDALCCCFNKRSGGTEGRIRLPHKRTIDDYLDPSSPVNIEALLAEEELDLYNNHSEEEEEEGGGGGGAGISKFNPLTLNHISPFFDEEDAQFISEHRISAILVERPKLSSAHALKEGNVVQQELIDFITPKPSSSTSTSIISNRRFAFKVNPDIQEEEYEPSTDVQPQELAELSHIPTPTEEEEEEEAPLTTRLSSLAIQYSHIPTTNTNTQFPATTLSRIPPPSPSASTIKPSFSSNSRRRPSVSSVAAAVLGDKLDDFTEKLAFIKKNIKLNTEDSGSDHHERMESPTDFQDEFDFSKVTKNVRTFGEGVMGNGIRMFNQLSTRIKNANNKDQMV